MQVLNPNVAGFFVPKLDFFRRHEEAPQLLAQGGRYFDLWSCGMGGAPTLSGSSTLYKRHVTSGEL
jgi:hypothetical protein